MKIRVINDSKDILACFVLLKQLVEGLEKKDFLSKLKQKKNQTYKLIILEEKDKPLAVAGIRFYNSYRFDKYLEVDDFVVDKKNRRNGYGKALFNWLIKYAKKNNCCSIQLNSRLELNQAHKFYKKMGMNVSHYRFYKNLTNL